MQPCMRSWTRSLVLICLAAPAVAQATPPARPGEARNALRRDELGSIPLPRQARDIDTAQLASAQRERAASVEEKTNGLWQSWLVSICEGCGNTASYRKTVGDDFANRRGQFLSRADDRALRRQALASRMRAADRAGRSLYADLSTDSIRQIRRMPGP